MQSLWAFRFNPSRVRTAASRAEKQEALDRADGLPRPRAGTPAARKTPRAAAAHLLEDKTGIRYTQKLLSHNSLRTTWCHTRMARRAALKTRSPLDDFGKDDD
jgi:hypothetical protein